MRPVYGRHSLGSHTKEAFRAPPAFWCRGAPVRPDISLRLQPLQRGINGTDRDLTLGAALYLTTDRHSIGMIFQAQQRQDNYMLEFA